MSDITIPHDTPDTPVGRNIISNIRGKYGHAVDGFLDWELLVSFAEYTTSEDAGDEAAFTNWLRHLTDEQIRFLQMSRNI